MVFTIAVLVLPAMFLYLVATIKVNRHMRISGVFVGCVLHFLLSLCLAQLRALRRLPIATGRCFSFIRRNLGLLRLIVKPRLKCLPLIFRYFDVTVSAPSPDHPKTKACWKNRCRCAEVPRRVETQNITSADISCGIVASVRGILHLKETASGGLVYVVRRL